MKRPGFGGTPLALALAVLLLPIGLSATPTDATSLTVPTTGKHDAEPFVRGQPTLWRGDHYLVKGERQDLVRRVDRVVVQLRADAPTDTVATLSRTGGALAGFAPAQRLRNGLTVFESAALASDATQSTSRAYEQLTRTMGKLAAEPAVAWVAPAFVNANYGTYAIATDEVLVRLRPGTSATDFFADARFANARPAASSDAYIARAAAGAGEAVFALAAALQNDPRILWAEPNLFQERKRQFTPDDPLFAAQWHLDNTGQGGGTPGADAHLVEAWDLVPSGASDVVIAIVDDGPDMTHPDLSVFQNPGEIPANGIDDDGNGYVDDMIGWDFTSGGLGDDSPGATTPMDFHATPVAGVAAARGNNAQGVTGAAFGARVFAARIFGDDGFATDDASIGSALAYSAGRGRAAGDNNWHGADITNNSWGGGAPASAIDDALQWAADNGRNGLGAANFFATGNSGAPFIDYPASLADTIASVIAVGASNNFDTRSTYSQYGEQLDLVAPSNGGTLGITTTDRLGANGINGLPDPDYTNGFGGTSSASPLAAGIGALMLGADPTLSVPELRALLRNSADKIGNLPYVDGFNVEYGYGRINAAAAVSAIGNAQIHVYVDDVEAEHTVAVPLDTIAGEALPITVTLRSAGQETLELGDVSLAGADAFTLEEPIADTSLALGESTTFVLGFIADDAGGYDTVVTVPSNDADTPAFQLAIHVETAAVSIGGNVFEDWNGNGTADPGDLPRAAVPVYLDIDNDGQLDLSTPQVIASAPNLSLVFGQNPTQAIHALQVAGLPPRLDRVTVTIDADHTWVGDVMMRLIAPNGTAIVLTQQPGGGNNDGQNFIGTTFDDNAPSSINNGFAPYSGTFAPDEPLSTFIGIDPNGNWTLELTDLFPAVDDGALQRWSITLHTGAEPTTLTDADGNYRFLDLAPGAYRVGVDTPAWQTQQPVGGFHDVTVIASENNTDVDFAQARRESLYGRVYTDIDSNGAFDPDDLPLADQILFLDANGDGALADAVTGSMTHTPGAAIPDADATGVSDTILVAEPNATTALVDLRVELDITHTWISDLTVRLTAPDGRSIALARNAGGDGDGFSGTVFDDAAAESVDEGQAPFTGTFRPSEPLSTFDGINVNGEWTLTVVDEYGADIGTLDRWALTFDYQTEPTGTTNAFGNYRFDVAPGDHDVRLLDAADTTLTQPLAGHYPVAIAGGGLARNLDFGLGLPNQAPIGFNLPDVVAPIDAALVIDMMQAFTDPDGNVLTYSADGLPPSLGIDAVTGKITGVPVESELGSHVVTVTATDDHGASASLDFVLTVVDTPIFADGFED